MGKLKDMLDSAFKSIKGKMDEAGKKRKKWAFKEDEGTGWIGKSGNAQKESELALAREDDL